LIVLAIFLVFGPGKLPELARNLGKFINEMKRATEDIKYEINREAERKEREKKLSEYKEKVKNREDITVSDNGEKNTSQKEGEDEKQNTSNTEDAIIDKIKIEEPDTSIPKNQ
jgi:sec-independent protein translocase protein TatB